MTNMDDTQLIEELISNREKFNEFVYTPLEEAVEELKKRESNDQINNYLNNILSVKIPNILSKQNCAVLARPIATPNYEMLRFFHITDALDFNPVIWEYTNSKFIPQNIVKYALARLCFYFGDGKKGGAKTTYLNILDIHSSSGKMIDSINTINGKSLVNFHHSMFLKRFPNMESAIFEGSDWYQNNGCSASKYYKPYLSLFLNKAILFDNFLVDKSEISFTKDIFLPAFINIIKEVGMKPLIVALEPTDIEGDNFWICYPDEWLGFVKESI